MSKFVKLLENRILIIIILLLSILYNSSRIVFYGLNKNIFFYSACLIICYLIFKSFKEIKNDTVAFLFLLFIGIQVVSSLFNSNLINLSAITESIINLIFLFGVYMNDISDSYKVKIEKNISLVIFVLLVISLLTYIFNVSFTYNYMTIGYDGRLYGVFTNPNTLGIVSIIGILLAIKNFKNKGLLAIYFIISVIVILLSGSRTSLIFLLVGIGLFLFNSKLNKKNIYIVCSILLLTMIILCIFMANDFNLYLKLNELSSNRFRIWRDAIKLSFNNPLIGNGVGNFMMTFCSVFGSEHIVCLEQIKSAHNIVVDVMYTTGILGISCFGLFSGKIISFFDKMSKNDKLLLCFCFFVSLLDYSFINSNSLLAFVFWFTLSNYRKELK